jgi:PAS domain S-box-containing protein
MTSKHAVQATQREILSDLPVSSWFLITCLLLLAVAFLLVLVALSDRLYASNLSTCVLAVLAVLLGFTGFLHFRGWHLGSKGFAVTESQFTSIYLHALDAILILDDEGVCLDANPAAFALLGAPPAVLVGHSFAQFYADSHKFELEWRRFLEQSYRKGPAQLFRPDGSKVFVHFSATANYVPGRHVMILCDTTERIEAQDSLRDSNERLQQMADHIQEIFWLLDTSTKRVLQVNRAYETITGHSIESLSRDPKSYVDLIHADDRRQVLTKLEDATHSGQLNEEFRIMRPDGEVRWVWVHGFPVRNRADGAIHRLAGTVQDITARKLADAQIAKHLVEAENARDQADAARAEADALRKATLALTQNLRMDVVLDTLLACVFELIPYERASVILTETDGRLFVARESPVAKTRAVTTFEPTENVFLQRVLVERKSVHLSDAHKESEWRDTKGLIKVRDWIAVPLVVGDSVLGLLSVSTSRPQSFSTEHFRLAKSLAIPAAVAIHNARLYEWAQIYAAERESLLKTNGTRRDGFLQ